MTEREYLSVRSLRVRSAILDGLPHNLRARFALDRKLTVLLFIVSFRLTLTHENNKRPRTFSLIAFFSLPEVKEIQGRNSLFRSGSFSYSHTAILVACNLNVKETLAR